MNYVYDAVGRLSELTDGSGNPIVTYTYDADGRLSQKTNGNGTYTTYQYDADGNVLHLINYAPGGTINSRFDYTYNALGLETTETTLDGTGPTPTTPTASSSTPSSPRRTRACRARIWRTTTTPWATASPRSSTASRPRTRPIT